MKMGISNSGLQSPLTPAFWIQLKEIKNGKLLGYAVSRSLRNVVRVSGIDKIMTHLVLRDALLKFVL